MKLQLNSVLPVYLEGNIKTKFNRYGSLFKNSSPNSQLTTPFNKGQKCQVLAYYGNDKYKIQLKGFTGFVTSEYLDINDDMADTVRKYNQNMFLKRKNDSIQRERKKAFKVQK